LSSGLTVGPLQVPPRPIALKKHAELVGVELAWEEFRDDLIRFELPAGATPNPDSAQGREAAAEGKPKFSKLVTVRAFLDAKYPEGIPVGLTDKAIARLVSDDARAAISERTVRRARSI
jgi:hypothetical protein